jgi:4-diphosphocytidyl-2-C-methyl-D-erythritol kinase
MTLDVGDEYGALGTVVSGSGPTCAFLARDEEHALDLAVALTASGTCRTVTSGVGPVGGARVVDA